MKAQRHPLEGWKPVQAPDNDHLALPYVESHLDEYGLSPAQFRVMAHVARRGVCYASLAGIAETCRLHRDTVIDCLGFLVERRLLAKKCCPGFATGYWQLPRSLWLPARNEGAPETNGHPSKPGPSPLKRRGNHLPETKGHKVNPIEVTPLKALNGHCAGAGASENELMVRAREFFGQKGMEDSGGMYRTLIRQDPGKFNRALADLECQRREGKQWANPGGYFMDTWMRFA
jgi:hypothetical protein